MTRAATANGNAVMGLGSVLVDPGNHVTHGPTGEVVTADAA